MLSSLLPPADLRFPATVAATSSAVLLFSYGMLGWEECITGIVVPVFIGFVLGCISFPALLLRWRRARNVAGRADSRWWTVWTVATAFMLMPALVVAYGVLALFLPLPGH